MRTIRTKFHGPTNTRGSRVSAKTPGGNKVIINWDPALNSNQNHDMAFRTLAVKLGFVGKWYSGYEPGGGRIYVCPLGEPDQIIREQDIA